MATMVPSPTRQAVGGMVCSIDAQASQAGLQMLHRGGTAADAAVATNAVLAVTCQHVCGMGGDLFALVHTGQPGPPSALNASGRAGSGGDPERLRAEGRTEMPMFDDIRSVPVPGCVDGWLALHQRYGRLPLSEVLGPARRYAERGFVAAASLAASLARWADRDLAGDYTEEGTRRLAGGDVVRRPALAEALADIAAHGRAGWYGGRFGEELVELGGGEYRDEDLRRPLADWVEPIGLPAWGHDVWTIPPNSQGYLVPASAWIASGLEFPTDPDDPHWAHVLVEASRQAAHDRVAVLHEGADGQALLATSRLAPRRGAIDPSRAAELGGHYRGGGTTALVAVDGEGMGVSLIQSNASGFGSGLGVPGLRVFLQNRGLGFSLEPGHPAEYGPGRRPPHTLAPALVTRPDGELAIVTATMGGDTQPQILLQVLARMLQADQSVGDAISAGRFGLRSVDHTAFDTWNAGEHLEVRVEGHAPSAWRAGLSERGHRVEGSGPFSSDFGHAHAIRVSGGIMAGAADPRHATSQVACY